MPSQHRPAPDPQSLHACTPVQPPPSILTWLAPKVLRHFPNFPYYAVVAVKDISHDEEVQKWSAADKLIDGNVYLKCLPGPLLGGAKMLDEDYKHWPQDKALLVAHGGADPVTSCKASKELVERTQAADKEYKQFDGLLHECWHEAGDAKVQFIEYIVECVWQVRRGVVGSADPSPPQLDQGPLVGVASVHTRRFELVVDQGAGAMRSALLAIACIVSCEPCV